METDDIATKTAAVNRFLSLARRGRHPGSSSGERIANTLAKAIHRIGDDFCILDREAIEGAGYLMQAAGGPFASSEAKDSIFRLIREAAGK